MLLVNYHFDFSNCDLNNSSPRKGWEGDSIHRKGLNMKINLCLEEIFVNEQL